MHSACVINAFFYFAANLQAFSFGFWQDYKAETGSFAGLGASIGSLKSLKHLSLSQSILYPENYDINTDELNDSLFMRLSSGCPDLRDVHLGSFYAVTPLTWTVCFFKCNYYCRFELIAVPLGTLRQLPETPIAEHRRLRHLFNTRCNRCVQNNGC